MANMYYSNTGNASGISAPGGIVTIGSSGGGGVAGAGGSGGAGWYYANGTVPISNHTIAYWDGKIDDFHSWSSLNDAKCPKCQKIIPAEEEHNCMAGLKNLLKNI